jgi:hypothetical protein
MPVGRFSGHQAPFFSGLLRLRPGLEAAAEREVHVHALDALLGLHADQRRLRGAQRELTLCDESEVGAADLF